jgi:hypothetical protein
VVFPHRGNISSIVWKNPKTFFHCVEKIALFFHTVENFFSLCPRTAGWAGAEKDSKKQGAIPAK